MKLLEFMSPITRNLHKIACDTTATRSTVGLLKIVARAHTRDNTLIVVKTEINYKARWLSLFVGA